jgi:hypothetical protein
LVIFLNLVYCIIFSLTLFIPSSLLFLTVFSRISSNLLSSSSDKGQLCFIPGFTGNIFQVSFLYRCLLLVYNSKLSKVFLFLRCLWIFNNYLALWKTYQRVYQVASFSVSHLIFYFSILIQLITLIDFLLLSHS